MLKLRQCQDFVSENILGWNRGLGNGLRTSGYKPVRKSGNKILDIAYFIAYVFRKKGNHMRTITATKARANLYKILDDANDTGEPIQITGKRSNAILLSENDWRAISETLYLLSIPGMRESIREGLETKIDECDTEIEW